MSSAAITEDAFEPHAAGPALMLGMQLERQARALNSAGEAVQDNVTHALAGEDVQQLSHRLSEQSTRLLENATVSLTPLAVLEAQRGLFIAWTEMMTAFSRIAFQSWPVGVFSQKGD